MSVPRTANLLAIACVLCSLAAVRAADDPLPDGALVRFGSGLQFRHGPGRVSSVAWAPDGKTLASHEAAGPVHVWTSEGKLLRRLDPGPNTAVFLAFGPDGRRLLGLPAYSSQPLRLWEVATGRERANLRMSSTRSSAAWSRDGKVLVVAISSRVSVLDPNSFRELRQFTGHQSSVRTVALAPSGKLAASANSSTRDGVRLWDPGTGSEYAATRSSPVTRTQATSLAFSPDGKLLATLNQSRVFLWDTATGKPVRDFPGPPVSSYGKVQFSPDGKFVAVGSSDIRLLRVADGAIAQQFPAALTPATGTAGYLSMPFAFSPDGKRLASCSGARVCLWDVGSGKELYPVNGHTAAVHTASFAADGRRLVTGGTDRTVRLWDAATGKEVTREQTTSYTRPAVGIAPDGESVVFTDLRTAKIWKPGGEIQERPSGSTANWDSLTPDGRFAVVRGVPGRPPLHSVVVHDLRANRVVRTVAPPRGVTAFRGIPQLTPDGQRLLLVASTGEIHLMDVETGERLARIPSTSTQKPTPPLPLSFDGRLLLTSAPEGLTLLESLTGKVRLRLEGQALPGAAFSPDGQLLAIPTVVDQGPMTRLIDVATGQECGRLRFGRPPYEFSPDSRRLLVQEQSGILLLADISGFRRKEKKVPFTAQKLDDLWKKLGSVNASEAHAAVWELSRGAGAVEALLGKRLTETKSPEGGQIRKLITQLDAEAFVVRERAHDALYRLGAEAAPILREVLRGKPSAEARWRIEDLLEVLDTGAPLGRVVRPVRALEALERLRTPEARKVLETVAGSAKIEPLVRREARAALGRLTLLTPAAPKTP